MELTTLLNRCYHFKGFVYKEARFAPGKPDTIEVGVVPRQGSKPYCSGCGKRRPGYDRLPERTFEFIPFWGFAVFLRYARRRVDCPPCGITAELLPWAEGKHHLTTAYMQFLAHWARKLSWLEVTTGRGRADRQHLRHGASPKRIWLYPLVPNARQRLTQAP